MHIFDVILLGSRCDLADVRHPAAQFVDIGHREIDAALMGRREDVQHGVGAATHSDIEGHGVFEGLTIGHIAGQHAFIVLLVIALGDVDDDSTGLTEQALTIGMRGQRGAIAGKRQTECLGQTVHRIRSEHS
ncbi:unannotated protein [freshwater metagenome]|uniref:Unannotated protein n=1 Tax=freshwater metagenome TaxID=449393 RepID=A0A6J5YHI8_9ZZZZ